METQNEPKAKKEVKPAFGIETERKHAPCKDERNNESFWRIAKIMPLP